MENEQYLFGRDLAKVNARARGVPVKIDAIILPPGVEKFEDLNCVQQGYYAAMYHFMLNSSSDHESVREILRETMGAVNVAWLDSHRMRR